MRIAIETDGYHRYVAIDVPLPAGLETVDTNLGAGAQARVLAPEALSWVSHHELRRDRVLLYVDDLAPGRHTYRIDLRATTPGRYVMPTAHVEEMYDPTISGSTATATLRVVAP